MNAIATVNCPFCQGNTRNDRRTLYLYQSDTYWCARCKRNGVVTDLDPSVISGITPSVKTQEVKQYKYNNEGKRFSVCKQRYYDGNNDVFQIKQSSGEVTGHYTRWPNKQSHIEGAKNFCYREQYLEIGGTYRLVEGTYDCIYPNDVALLGFPNQAQVKQLKLYHLILCPDGDVWKNKEQCKRWFEPFKWSKNILHVEYIKDSKDPDECPLNERKQLDFNKVKEWLSEND